jgi:glutaminyl-tRNA synthetase
MAMKEGGFEEGEAILRAKIDLAADNMKMRDPIMYRIRYEPHHRTVMEWCIYPMYDFAHALSDSIEGITYSICTLEFDNNRELYDWYVENSSLNASNKQYEMARLNLEYNTLSKRKLAELVDTKLVKGWDDSRMPTLSGLRRRGITPAAIRKFVSEVGIAKADDSRVSMAFFNSVIRDDLNEIAPRLMGVLDPVTLIIKGLPGSTNKLEANWWPKGTSHETEPRTIHLTDKVFVERSDFAIEPPGKWKRLAPGRVVRLKYGCLVRCTGYREEGGEVIEIQAEYIEGSLGGSAPEGIKPKGTIHWVSAYSIYHFPATFIMYNNLFIDEEATQFNYKGTSVKVGYIEAQPLGKKTRWQLERVGYFYHTDDSHMRLIVPLKDGYRRK